MKDESGHILSSTVNLRAVDERLINRLRQWSHAFAAIVIAVGILALAGWSFHITILTRPIPGSVAMHPLTAFSLILFGGSFLLILPAVSSATKKNTGYIIIAVLIAITALKIAGELFHWQWQ